jgi:hypothetical protein
MSAAETLRDHSRALEAASRNGDDPTVTDGVPAAEQELAQVLETLREFLRATPG